ncbi:MAG TPA: monofunctional biosynthetic peptidoglycan transglycosylase [Candidatus Binatia bacterium]|jgi:monofunctional biosynthetic peptidoglycan transglycosylase
MRRVLLSSLAISAIVGACFYFYSTLPTVTALKQRNPKSTALMELRDKEYRSKNIRAPRRQIWVAYGAISDHLKKAILINEDAGFFNHRGVDLDELKAALKKDWDTLSFSRGGSTITMQLAKNLYLNPSKNPLRKLREIVIARQLERSLSKQRIFEIYLNVVEFGRNVYGAEAAARFYFGKSAGALDPLEAATLAALLPSPRNAKERSILNRRNLILGRLASVGYISNDEYQRAKQTPLFQKVEETAPELPRED